MQNTVATTAADEIVNVSQGEKIEGRKKYDSWTWALALVKAAGLSPSSDVLALAEQEKRGEITTKDMLQYLDKKYEVKERD